MPAGVRRLIVATFALFLAFNVFYAIFPIDAEARRHFAPSTMGTFYTVLSVLLILAEGPLLGAAAKRIGPRQLFAGGMVLLALAFASFVHERTTIAFVGAALFALGNGLSWPTFQARIADAAGPDAQGVVQGAAASASSLASVVGLVAAGLLYDQLGSLLFLVAASVFLALAIISGRLFDDAHR